MDDDADDCRRKALLTFQAKTHISLFGLLNFRARDKIAAKNATIVI